MTDRDIYRQFRDVWDAEYPTWLSQSQNAWQGDHQDYRHGNYILPPCAMVSQAWQDRELVTQGLELVKAAMLQSKVGGLDGTDRNGDLVYFDSHYGWTAQPGESNYVSALSELCWASGAATLCEAVVLGQTRATTEQEAFAKNVLQWIDVNMIQKRCHVSRSGRWDYLVNKFANGGSMNPRSKYFDPKIFILYHIAACVRSGTGMCHADTDMGYGTPTDAWDAFFVTDYTYVDRRGCLRFDDDNPHCVPHAKLGPQANQQDTMHANYLARAIGYELARNGAASFPPNFDVMSALSKTVVNLLWDGNEEHPLCNNYVHGIQGTDTEGNQHPVSGIEGWGWWYSGWAQCYWSDDVQQLMQATLNMVNKYLPTNGYGPNATYGRHSTSYGQIGLCGSLLWSKWVRDQ